MSAATLGLGYTGPSIRFDSERFKLSDYAHIKETRQSASDMEDLLAEAVASRTIVLPEGIKFSLLIVVEDYWQDQYRPAISTEALAGLLVIGELQTDTNLPFLSSLRTEDEKAVGLAELLQRLVDEGNSVLDRLRAA